MCIFWFEMILSQLGMDHSKRDGKSPTLPPPPPVIPPSVVPLKAVNRLPMPRPGVASRGQRISLLTNHFNVSISKTDGHFYHYSVCIFISGFSFTYYRDNS